MSTNAYIGITHSDGSVDYVYLHWDGYDSYAGKKLRENYKTEEQVRELISHGAISVLGDTIGERHDFDKASRDFCTFYNRDRGEELKIGATATIRGFLNKDIEYKYLFQNGKWTTY